MSCQLLPNECIQQILKCIKHESNSLFSCLLINRHWCRNTVKFLYAKPFFKSDFNIIKNLVIRTYISCLNEIELRYLASLQIKPPSSKPLFDYAVFLEELNFQIFIETVNKYVFQDYAYFTEVTTFKNVIECISSILLQLIMRSGTNLKTLKVNNGPLDPRRFIPVVKEIFTIQPGLSNLTKFEAFIDKYNEYHNYKINQIFELIPLICENIEILNIISDEYNFAFEGGERPKLTESLIPNLIKSQKRLLEFKFINSDYLLPNIFKQLKKHENSLKILSLTRIDFKEIKEKKECLPSFKNLESLCLSNCEGLELEQLEILLGSNSNHVKKLELRMYNYWPHMIQSELFRIIGDSLQSLALNLLSNEIVNSILRCCPNLVELKIFFLVAQNVPLFITLVSRYSLKSLTFHTPIYISVSILEDLGKNIPHTLEYLNLRLNYKRIYLEKLFENCKANLKVLILEKRKEIKDMINYLDLNAIIKYVEERRSLKFLGISGVCNQEFKGYQLLKEKYNVKIIPSEELHDWQ